MKAGIDIAKMQTKCSTIHHGQPLVVERWECYIYEGKNDQYENVTVRSDSSKDRPRSRGEWSVMAEKLHHRGRDTDMNDRTFIAERPQGKALEVDTMSRE